ncbi:MAG: TetR family transcriptional regulator [Marmoricola sp.]|nr:TetR family transcriptional regulator [Marmoricola sp.]
MKPQTSYHHGDLPAACVRAALELLEDGEPSATLSLRAVARRAGVAPSAPYRHFADRDALLTAVATVGYGELAEHLAAACPAPTSPEELADVAVAYVEFAVKRAALFRAMFGEPCDHENPERVAATAVVKAYVADLVGRCFPGSDADALGTAVWALVHGLAFLELDGKLDDAPDTAYASVRSAVRAVLDLARQPAGSS